MFWKLFNALFNVFIMICNLKPGVYFLLCISMFTKNSKIINKINVNALLRNIEKSVFVIISIFFFSLPVVKNVRMGATLHEKDRGHKAQRN